jgi:hypothetical protein
MKSDNEMGLRKVIDLTRMISIIVLLLHFYFYCYAAFKEWHLTAVISDRILHNVAKAGLFKTFYKSKLIALGFLALSLLGAKGKKDEKLSYKTALAYVLTGLLLYGISFLAFYMNTAPKVVAVTYMTITGMGFILFMTGGTLLTRVIKQTLSGEVFNKQNESFPQEERLLRNEYSINLPTQYRLKGKIRPGWINIINPFRGILIMGSPGSGKTYFVIRHIIRQHIENGFSMFVYDFKFDDLTKIAYNCYLQYRKNYPIPPEFYVISFEDLSRSHRCNPLAVASMSDVTDAAEAARTILLGLNQEWISKQGDFWVESAINFLTAIIWFLCRYESGRYCTLPHVVELAQTPYDKLFSLLRSEPQVEALITPFVTAYFNDAKSQLEGQIASATVGLSKLSSPHLYYILSGNDFSLDINHPARPKIVCMGNNPQKAHIYGAIVSLYVTALTRELHKKGRHKTSLVMDEFPTLYFNGIDNLIATARSNKIATTISVQDASQLKLHYGKEQADVILNITGNVISGQVANETAKQLSERFGKILQDRESLAIGDSTSITKSKQLDLAIPQSTIASLSSGEFVGMVADNPDQVIELKTFHSRIVNNHQALAKEQAAYAELPVIREVNQQVILANYLQIKKEVAGIITAVLESMLNSPEMAGLLVKKRE